MHQETPPTSPKNRGLGGSQQVLNESRIESNLPDTHTLTKIKEEVNNN